MVLVFFRHYREPSCVRFPSETRIILLRTTWSRSLSCAYYRWSFTSTLQDCIAQKVNITLL